jgi:hypothetical protein
VSRTATSRLAPQHRRPVPAAAVEGNEKLTAMTGALLLIGFAVEGFTILSLHQLLFLHFVVGLLLIGPVLLKIGSTGYRFVRYYSGSQPYVRKGAPSPVMRVLGPLVILTSVAVIGTGTVLALVGRNATWLFLHKASFVLWFGVMTVHVLNYAPRLPRMLTSRAGAEPGGEAGAGAPFDGRRPTTGYSADRAVPGRGARWLLLAASLAIGVGVAAITMHISSYWGFSL